MHPSLSVIAFTTLSGAGYGMLLLLGMRYAASPLPLSREYALVPFAVALGLVTAGLLSSLAHLGHPARAWRALTQWRSSWLSREGVCALLAYVPVLALVACIWLARFDAAARAAALATALGAVATVLCTAMIYASLKAVPAWRSALVPLVYLLFAPVTGAALLAALLALSGWRPQTPSLALFAAGVAALALCKLVYWRRIDHPASPSTAHATGLSRLGRARSFEAPHTEGSFITREMGFVLARRHSRSLRAIALVLLLVVPLAATAWAALQRSGVAPAALLAALSLLAGGFVERWLFFAEARHVVAAYFESGHADSSRINAGPTAAR